MINRDSCFKKAARSRLCCVTPKSLILADFGHFGVTLYLSDYCPNHPFSWRKTMCQNSSKIITGRHLQKSSIVGRYKIELLSDFKILVNVTQNERNRAQAWHRVSTFLSYRASRNRDGIWGLFFKHESWLTMIQVRFASVFCVWQNS